VKDKTSEFENFDRTMRDLIRVPHDEIKAELQAEKAKKPKPARTSKDKNDKGNQNSN
jgi:hypothetical protein